MGKFFVLVTFGYADWALKRQRTQKVLEVACDVAFFLLLAAAMPLRINLDS